MASRWNENEIEIIKKHFTTMTNKEIKDKYLPHRSTASIAYMGSKYGLINAYYCPVCNSYIRSIVTRREVILAENIFCGVCGQKINWENDKE